MRSKAGSYASLVYRTVRYVEQAADNKWVIKEDPLCLIDLLNAIHEQQCCGGVADEERETTDVIAYDPAEEMVRMTGASVENSLESLQPCNRPALSWTTDCVGCGFDGASAMSSERVGAAALVRSKAPLSRLFSLYDAFL